MAADTTAHEHARTTARQLSAYPRVTAGAMSLTSGARIYALTNIHIGQNCSIYVYIELPTSPSANIYIRTYYILTYTYQANQQTIPKLLTTKNRTKTGNNRTIDVTFQNIKSPTVTGSNKFSKAKNILQTTITIRKKSEIQ